jgi:hypothetical protein
LHVGRRRKILKYLESAQIIPNKGMSYTMYEIEGDDKILRMITSIPEMDELHVYPKPVVKKLYKPELCKEIESSLFLSLWEEGMKRKG